MKYFFTIVFGFIFTIQAQNPEMLNLEENILKSNLLNSESLFYSKFKNEKISKAVQIDNTVAKTINITAGSLRNSLTTDEKKTITDLTLSGTIDARDFTIMRDSMPVLSVIDIRSTNINYYSGIGGTADKIHESTIYIANEIPIGAFWDGSSLLGKTSLTKFYFPASIKSISQMAFLGCVNLSEINIPESITSINIGAFAGCSAPINVSISSLYYCSINGVLFNKNKTNLIQCPITVNGNYDIPQTVTVINNEAFFNCSNLISVTIPSSLQKINNLAFSMCNNILSINIPASVNYIGTSAFSNCIGLETIKVNTVTPLDLSLSSGVFNNIYKDACTLYVPLSSKPAYQAANQWKDFTNIVEFDPTSVSIIHKPNINIASSSSNGLLEIKGLEYPANVIIYSLQGRKVLNKTVNPNEQISINSLPRGVYIIKANSKETAVESKLIKQ